ncbi:putative metalloproteinase inhibitor 1-like [Apostichopus japonicus]|uniref:Putative metalloproteinase inhibitor 1-like n=1 Tax=Stichopus japonicus TaxID=307972 RepID=A0A2G8JGX4_STIJA|nr:putative metalloproteinase inhibitor 1-like [Apostichopus japonicus]
MLNVKVFMTVILAATPIVLSSNVNTFQRTGGCDCPSRHPQQTFCDESLVIKGTILSIGNAEVTGHDDGSMNMDMLIEVRVNEMFKGDERIQLESTISIHTYGMCRFEMMLTVGEVYVLSANDVHEAGYYVILRGCSWAQTWNSITQEQLNGLRGDYHDCHLCEISKSLTTYNVFEEYSFMDPAPSANRPIGTCFHNQQMAFIMRRYEDCETLYSACVVHNDECEWLENREYRKCMKKRNKSTKRRKGKGGRPNGIHPGGRSIPKKAKHHLGRGREETTG